MLVKFMLFIALHTTPSDSVKTVFENNNVRIVQVNINPDDTKNGLVRSSTTSIWFADAADPTTTPQTAFRIDFKKSFVKAAPSATDDLDAVKAAPTNHHIVYEDENLRILLVTGMAGETEKIHTHRWPSIIWFTQPVPLTNYRFQLKSNHEYALLDSMVQKSAPPANMGIPLDAEGPHAIKNTGTIEGVGYRVEFKNAFAQ